MPKVSCRRTSGGGSKPIVTQPVIEWRMLKYLAAATGMLTSVALQASGAIAVSDTAARDLPNERPASLKEAHTGAPIIDERHSARPIISMRPLPDLPRARLAFNAVPDPQAASAAPAQYGPQDANEAKLTEPQRFRSFGSQVGSIKWELGAVAAYYTAVNGTKLFEDPTAPHFHKEGWFGESTKNVGVDKLAHAYSAYVISELLHARLKRKTGDAPGIQYTAAALASGIMLYTELWDSIERSAGWSWEDVTFNSLGSGFSILRNSVPGLDAKLDYRLMIVPNANIINTQGKRHFEQQRYFFALKLSGFKAFEQSPFRFLELHAGYYGKNFTNEERAAGVRPKRRLFVGVGVNLRELFFKNAHSRAGRAAGEILDYFQPPYTAIHQHVTN